MSTPTENRFEEPKHTVAEIKKYAISRNLHNAEDKIPYPRVFRKLDVAGGEKTMLKVGVIESDEVLVDVHGGVYRIGLYGRPRRLVYANGFIHIVPFSLAPSIALGVQPEMSLLFQALVVYCFWLWQAQECKESKEAEDSWRLSLEIPKCKLGDLTEVFIAIREKDMEKHSNEYSYNPSDSLGRMAIKESSFYVRNHHTSGSENKESNTGADEGDGTKYADGDVSVDIALAILRGKAAENDLVLQRLPFVSAVSHQEHSESMCLSFSLYIGDWMGDDYYGSHMWAFLGRPNDDKERAPPMVLATFADNKNATVSLAFLDLSQSRPSTMRFLSAGIRVGSSVTQCTDP
jgi:hypothetical protein